MKTYINIITILLLLLLSSCENKKYEINDNSSNEIDNYIFYSNDKEKKIEIIDPEDPSLGIYLYSEGVKTKIDANLCFMVDYVSWSPKNEYALIDFGSYAIRSLSVIDVKNKIYLGNISLVWPQKIFWINENSVLIQVTVNDSYLDGPNIRSTIKA